MTDISSIGFTSDENGVERDLLLSQLESIVSAGRLLTGADRDAFAFDIYKAKEHPIAVVRPATITELTDVVRASTTAGAAVIPRGGGASYTGGYRAEHAQAILLDLTDLKRIVEINETDAYVTVEAGITWSELKEVLELRGWRTPFEGPFSGLVATVGGAISQYAVSHGSGAHGISALSVLSMDIVLADGSLLRTGSAAVDRGPFQRYFGPDWTGLFTGDCGALGIKATITLSLMRIKPAFEAATFAFESFAKMHAGMRAAAQERLDDTNFAMDSKLSGGQLKRQGGMANAISMAIGVLRSSPSLTAGLSQLVRMAMAGERALKRAEYAVHYIVEGANAQEARARLHRLRQVVSPHGGEITNTVPVVVRGTPFARMFNLLGPQDERWVPVHGMLPHSRADAFHDSLEAMYERRAADMERLGVWAGGLFETVGTSTILYEIAIYWPDALSAYHEAAIAPKAWAKLKRYPENLEARHYVEDLRQEIFALYKQFGATHIQLGKTYPYAQVLEPKALALMRALKAELDPKGLMNPGVLGL